MHFDNSVLFQFFRSQVKAFIKGCGLQFAQRQVSPTARDLRCVKISRPVVRAHISLDSTETLGEAGTMAPSIAALRRAPQSCKSDSLSPVAGLVEPKTLLVGAGLLTLLTCLGKWRDVSISL